MSGRGAAMWKNSTPCARRRSTFFQSLSQDAWTRRGIASDNPFSVRALAYIAAGHVAHHVRILRDQYRRLLTETSGASRQYSDERLQEIFTMTVRRLLIVAAALLAFAIPAMQAQEAGVPSDLKPLLAKPVSEMRLVVTRYNADRQALNQNYAGPGGFNMSRGGGRGQGAPAATQGTGLGPVPISPARLARLKRYDLDWQAALGRLTTAKFSTMAATDLTSLKATIENNLKQLESDNLQLAQMAAALPFAPKLVALIEARIRVDDINWESAARSLTEVRKWIDTATTASPSRMNAATAARAAEATDTLRAAITEWHSFYDGYDPMYHMVDANAVQAGHGRA